MPLAHIIKTIKQDAKDKAKEIKTAAEPELNVLAIQLDEAARRNEKKLLADLKLSLEKQIQSVRFQKESALKNEILRKKRQIIDDVFRQAISQIADDPENYSAFLTKQLRNLPEIKNGSLIIASQNQDNTKTIIKKVKSPYPLADKTVESRGGFILESPTLILDNTLETIIGQNREEMQIEVGGILFDDENALSGK